MLLISHQCISLSLWFVLNVLSSRHVFTSLQTHQDGLAEKTCDEEERGIDFDTETFKICKIKMMLLTMETCFNSASQSRKEAKINFLL